MINNRERVRKLISSKICIYVSKTMETKIHYVYNYNSGAVLVSIPDFLNQLIYRCLPGKKNQLITVTTLNIKCMIRIVTSNNLIHNL